MRLKEYINEKLEFKKAKDIDYMFGNQVMCFDSNFKYKLQGGTHKLHSHALKHLRAYKKHEYDKIVKEIKYVVTKQYKDKLKIYEKGKGIIAFGFDAIKLLSTEHILNYMDYLNDKIQLGDSLDRIERILKSYLDKFADAYEHVIRSYLDTAINVDNEDVIEIEKYIDNKQVLQFSGGRGKLDIQIFLSFKDYTVIFATGNMYKIRTMYKAEGVKNEKQLVQKIMNTNRITNDNVKLAFENILGR